MKQKPDWKHLAVWGLIVLSSCATTNSELIRRDSAATPVANNSAVICRSELDMQTALKKLASRNTVEADLTRKTLIEYSRKSDQCRKEIIEELIQAMDKPNLNFELDRNSYYLWLQGSMLLGDLKAAEALDLLINHLDLNDGLFSASMTHQPAVVGVTKMGDIALPKLISALRGNPNRNIRLAAALCLSEIRAPSAIEAMRQALRSESDQCVTRFIQLSIEIHDLKSETHPSESDSQWMGLSQRRLIALKCEI